MSLARSMWWLGGVAVVVAAQTAQTGYAPAQYRVGPLPTIPIQALGGGEVFVELSVGLSGYVTDVKVLRATPPFTDLVTDAVRDWQFDPAEDDVVPEGAPPDTPARRIPVTSKVLVAGIYRPPTINTPTLGEVPVTVASASDETPSPASTMTPPFPPLARDGGIVLVAVQVDADGKVAGARVIRSAPPFDAPALDAARQWTFRPARIHGAPAASLAYIAFAFRPPITGGGRPAAQRPNNFPSMPRTDGP